MANQAKRRQKNKQAQRSGSGNQGQEQATKSIPTEGELNQEESTSSFAPQQGGEAQGEREYYDFGAEETGSGEHGQNAYDDQNVYDDQNANDDQNAYDDQNAQNAYDGQFPQEGQGSLESQELQKGQEDPEAWGDWDSGSDSELMTGEDSGGYVDHGIAENVAPHHNDMVECEYCGERYSVTYRRCPFCDEKRGSGDYGMDPRHIVGFSISMVLICTAGFIVVKQVLPLLSPQTGETGTDSSVTQNDGSDGSGTVLDDMVVPTVPDVSVDEWNPSDFGEPDNALELDTSTATITGASGGLRVRSGPGTTYDILSTLLEGTAVTVISESSDGWYQINFSGSNGTQMGYVMGSFLDFGSSTPPSGSVDVAPTPTPEVTPTPTPEVTPTPTPDTNTTTGSIPAGAATVTGASGGLRVRGGPGTSYEVLATVYEGSDIVVVGAAGDGWYQITYNSSSGKETGYIMGDYIKPN